MASWCVDSGRGVLDHRSVLNVAQGLVVYFDGNRVHAVSVETLEDRVLLEIPADREAYGQGGCTPDGNWLAYIHVPAARLKALRGRPWWPIISTRANSGRSAGSTARCFTVTAYGNEHFVVTHPAEKPGMLLTDLTSGQRELLRGESSIAPRRSGELPTAGPGRAPGWG